MVMAAPATHIVLANKIYKKHFSDKEFSKFIVGTSFPDIRYLDVIDRHLTHFRNIKLDDIKSEDSFMTGVKLHSLVDEAREKFVVKNGMYKLFPESMFNTQGTKFFEDRVLYDKISNWSEILLSFNKVYNEEINFGVSKSDVERWHKYLQSILSNKPTDKVFELFISEIGKPKEIVEEMKRVVNNPSNEQKASQIILDFYDNFEDLIPS